MATIQHKWGSTSYTSEAFPTASALMVPRGGVANGDFVMIWVNTPWSIWPTSVDGGSFTQTAWWDHGQGSVLLYTKKITNAAGEPSSWQVSFSQAIEGNAIALCYSGVNDWLQYASYTDGTGNDTNTYPPNISNGGGPGRMVVHYASTCDYPFDFGTQISTTVAHSVPTGAGPLTNRINITGNDVGNGQGHSSFTWDRNLQTAAAGSSTGGLNLGYLSSLASISVTITLEPVNAAPNAPTLTYPTGNVTIERTVTTRFAWTFSDPDPGDSQSGYDLRYRIVGGPTWTTVSQTTPNQYRDMAIATNGAYEWQVRTYDAIGAVGPYSASSFFTVADKPPGPTITSPTNNGTVADSHLVTWSVTNQDDYQLRRVADNAGAPNTAVVYFDTGIVTSTSARSRTVLFDVNNRAEHVQIRVRDEGLWSDWVSVRVNVTYTPPAVPTCLVTNATTGALTVSATRPAPSGGQPTVTYYDVYRRQVGDVGDGIRRARGILPDAQFVDYFVASGVQYEYRVRDQGDNASATYSAWV